MIVLRFINGLKLARCGTRFQSWTSKDAVALPCARYPLSLCRCITKYTNHIPTYYDRYIFPEPPRVVSNDEHNTVVQKVNESIAKHGRLFAVVQIASKQFKITDHDLIRTTGYLDAEIGDRIRLEKVLLVGGSDFTLVGRPIIRRSLVHIEATVVEKTPGVVKVHQKFMKASNYEKRKFFTPLHTVVRINSIEAYPHLDKENTNTANNAS